MFSNGARTATITVAIIDDDLEESNESFEVRLSQPNAGALLGAPTVARVTIEDNDWQTNSLLTLTFPSAPPVMSGSLRVTIAPENVGGQWRFAWESGWRAGGELVTNLARDTYELEFRSVPGYVATSPRIVTSVTTNTITEVTNAYLVLGRAEVSSLTVNLGPSVVPSTARWRLLGEASWRPTGSTADKLAPGNQIIEFKAVDGWAAPALRQVTLVARQCSVVSGDYQVTDFLPEAVVLPRPLTHFNFIQQSLSNAPGMPYAFNGQLRSRVGWGSGVAVRERVVLTAAHLLFQDATLSYVSDVNWFFQRHAGQYDPKPLAARGWYLLSSYASARSSELALGLGPGESGAASRNADVAAVYFLKPAARGGVGGYLASDADPNIWLTSLRPKLLVGYPVDGAAFGDEAIVAGQMHATPVADFPFTHHANRVYVTTGFLSYPGNSGGPVYVQYTNDWFYRAVWLP